MCAEHFETRARATKVLYHSIPQPGKAIWLQLMLITNNGPLLILSYFSGSILPSLFIFSLLSWRQLQLMLITNSEPFLIPSYFNGSTLPSLLIFSSLSWRKAPWLWLPRIV